MAGRARLAAAGASLVAAAVVAGLVIGTGSTTPSRGWAGSTSGSGTATVQRRNLVQTDTESGTLSYAGSHTVYNRLSGTLTWLPAAGQVIKRGQTLFRVDNTPVILLYGSTPAYRDLDSSESSGPDIRELNANLVALGYNPDGIVVDDTWQAATTAGVDALQKARGETQTGKLSLGQVVFLPGKQLVNSLDGTVGSTGGGSSSGSSNAGYIPAGPPSTELVSYHPSPTGAATSSGSTTPTTTTTTTTSTSTSSTTTPKNRTPGHKPKHPRSGGGGTSTASLEALIGRLEREIAALNLHSGSGSPGASSSGSAGRSSPGASGGSTGTGGSGGSGGSGSSGGSPVAILQTSSTRLVATVELPASSQSEAVLGSHVTVELPDSSTVRGTITAVSPVASSSSSAGSGSANSGSGSGSSGSGSGGSGSAGSGSSATVPVTITLDTHVKGAGLDQASVSVKFAQARANNVLSVPVTALLATAGGGYAVQQATAPHRLIPVTTGLFAAGYVQISGSGIYPGLTVSDSQG